MGGRGSTSISSANNENKYEPIKQSSYRGVKVDAIEYNGNTSKRVVLTKPKTEQQIRQEIDSDEKSHDYSAYAKDLVTGRYASYERFGRQYRLYFADSGKGSKQKTIDYEGTKAVTSKKEAKEKMVEYMMTGKVKNYKIKER